MRYIDPHKDPDTLFPIPLTRREKKSWTASRGRVAWRAVPSFGNCCSGNTAGKHWPGVTNEHETPHRLAN